MKKNYFQLLSTGITLLWLCSSFISFGQNIVPNFSFEVQDTCPMVSEIILAQPWNSPTVGSPDLFNSTCASQNSPGRTGVGSSGIFCYSSFPNSREYLQAPLDITLTAGQAYCLSFYVRRSNFKYALSSIGAYFSVGAVNENITNPLNFTPQIQNDPNNPILSSSTWTEITGTFTANGGEDHIIIGNFYDDANTVLTIENPASSSEVAYYKIDDVAVTSCIPGSTSELAKIGGSISIYPVPAMDFINLELASNVEVLSTTILDLQGRIIKNVGLEISDAGIYAIDISMIATGTYFVSMLTPYGVINKKIMIF